MAGPFRRLAAYAVDMAFCGLVLFGLAVTITFIFGALGPSEIGFFMMVTLFLIIQFILQWFYGGFLETYWNGQTIGKRMLGIRVLSTDGQPINGLQEVMRNILRLADLYPPIYLMFDANFPFFMFTGLCGLLSAVLTSRYQRLGDLVCGTMVVVEEKSWLAGVIKLEDARVPQLAAEIPVNFVVTRTMAKALAAYAERRRHLSPARRHEIAAHLAEPLLAEFRLMPDTSYDLLLCALYYKAFVADQTTEEVAWSPATARHAATPVATLASN